MVCIPLSYLSHLSQEGCRLTSDVWRLAERIDHNFVENKASMKFSIAILGFIWYFVLLPLLVGALFLLTVGGTAAVAMAVPLLILLFVVTPAFRAVNVVPVLGRVLTGVLSIVIGLGLSAWFLMEFCLPMLVLVYHAMSGEALPEEGTLFMEFCGNHLEWAMKWCELSTAIPGRAFENDLPLSILKLLLMLPFLSVALFLPWIGALATLGWSLKMIVCPGKLGE